VPARHKSRQRALQVLYLWDQNQQPIEDAIQAFYTTLGAEDDTLARVEPDGFMETLARGTVRTAAEIDAKIRAKSTHWRLDRMAAVDRNILRLAIYEMQATETPPAVVIDEALELAREFSGEESVPFINGVLDAIRRESSR
jgi:N utilization substance protein B